MVKLNYANLTDSFEEDGKCYLQLEIPRKTCINWIHKSMKHNVTYKLQDVSNVLDGLFHIQKKNRNKITKIIESEDREEIDLNNSTISIQYVEDVETNYLNHCETGEDTVPDDDEVVNLNSSTSSIECIETVEDTLPDDDVVVNVNRSTSSIECIEDSFPKDEKVDLTNDDLSTMPRRF